MVLLSEKCIESWEKENMFNSFSLDGDKIMRENPKYKLTRIFTIFLIIFLIYSQIFYKSKEIVSAN